ncbi:MAG TPA: tetratricopeptide repeat protein [Verrucomicrobiae bacterium]
MKNRWIFLGIFVGVMVFNTILFAVVWVFRQRASTVQQLRVEETKQPADRALARRHVRAAFSLKESRQFADAISAFQNAIQADPDFSDGYHGLAQTQREAGDAAAAVANHDRAIQLDPERFDLYWERGVTHMRLKNYDAAIADFNTCLTKNSAFANAHLGLGQSYQHKGEFQKALEHHNESIAMKPDSAWFYRERGNTYRSMGDRQLADADFARARELEQSRR